MRPGNNLRRDMRLIELYKKVAEASKETVKVWNTKPSNLDMDLSITKLAAYLKELEESVR